MKLKSVRGLTTVVRLHYHRSHGVAYRKELLGGSFVRAALGDNVKVDDQTNLGPNYYSIVDELDPSLRWRIEVTEATYVGMSIH